jgi:hypothetical protein
MNRISFEPFQTHQSVLHGLVIAEGTPVLIHGIDVEGPTPSLRMVVEWRGQYWVDIDWGNRFQGPFETLGQAVDLTDVTELMPGFEHCTWIQEDQRLRLRDSLGPNM